VAYSTVDTHIQNPATRAGKGRRNVATKTRRKMTAKQIRHFGTKRQKAALRAKRNGPSKKHRARTKPNPSRKKRSAVAKAPAPIRRKKRAAKKSTVKRRKNPTPMIISWAAGNPAGGRKVAKTRKKKRATAKRSNTAGRRRAPKKMSHRRRRSNPGALGAPMDWIQGGAGVVVGAVGSRAIPQMLLGAGNTGAMGYAANAIAALGLGWLTHLAFPRSRVLVGAVIAGGFGGLIARVAADKTPFGSQLSLSGMGDWGLGLYQKSNFINPQRVMNGRLPSPGSSMFFYGDGSQARPATVQNSADSMSAC
jgi:hypothetical protein